MKKLALLLFIAAFAACTKFDCPSATPAQQRVLNYVSNAQFYRENERGRVSIRFYEADVTLKPVRLLNGTEVTACGQYNMIYYNHWPTFYCYQVSADGKHLYSAPFMGSGRFDTISISIHNDTTLVLGDYSYTKK
jgi:hypothetical protein